VLHGKELFTLRQALRWSDMSTEKQSIEERLKEIIIKQLDADNKPVTLESFL
jgi:hypothetical protein